MTPMHDTLTETELHPDEVEPEEIHSFTTAIPDAPLEDETAVPEETQRSFEVAMPEEPPASPLTLDEAARKQEKKAKKLKKKEEKRLKEKAEKKNLKEKKNSTKALAVTFPMVELIDEQVRTSIPEELVAKVKGAKSKKHIINANYPYPKQMKGSKYLEEIELQVRKETE